MSRVSKAIGRIEGCNCEEFAIGWTVMTEHPTLLRQFDPGFDLEGGQARPRGTIVDIIVETEGRMAGKVKEVWVDWNQPWRNHLYGGFLAKQFAEMVLVSYPLFQWNTLAMFDGEGNPLPPVSKS